MDLRNLSSTPNQLDTVMQRRPSLSSLSSTSGYASSSYAGGASAANGQASSNVVAGGANPMHQASNSENHTPQMSSLKLSGDQGNRMYSGMSSNSSSTNLAAAGGIPPASVVSNVVPWVEQQKQQQALTMNSLDNGKKGSSQKSAPLSGPDASPSIAPMVTTSANASTTMEDDDDELIPTAIVIKNIPFAIKKEQLLDVMTKLNLPLPYAFNYHFDNGVFRGLAFANFTSTDETSMVVNQLNGREIGGRKLRVEYKKMLPAQERERIEREKREKRGQLEEQHRSNSNASLASLISAASTTAATKNLSVNGAQYNSQTERLLTHFPSSNANMPPPPVEVNFNDPDVLELYSQLLTYRDDNSKLIFELAFPANISLQHRKVFSLLCSYLNLLELYDNGLIIIRRKPGQQTIQQRQQQSATFNPHLHHQQQGSAPAATTPQHHSQQQQQHQQQHQQHQSQQSQQSQQPPQSAGQQGQNNGGGHPQHSNSMMNINQLPALLSGYPNNLQTPNPHAPELLRSQSQSALPLTRLRQSSSTPVQQQYSQYPSGGMPGHKNPPASQGANSKYQSFVGYGGNSAGNQNQVSQLSTPNSSSAAALLRSSNNRSFVDVRNTPPLAGTMPSQSVSDSPTPQHTTTHGGHVYQGQQGQNFFGQGAQISQPGTPLGNADLNNRFAPFGQHAHLNGSFSSLQPTSANSEEFSLGGDGMSSKLNGLTLGNGYEQNKSSGSGIWGPKK
ncbi:hypothetical protein FT663_00272 [Candidozyma haemuli var. vulneris]|uniref:RRM domain-containing protein n=1 Tax=Candidozyma haemuli TaxID=45357 RepID=A0A2V1ARY0_9ASCO|nr:hypothetical protein CXQ85_003545 [[Candida] haemuloni]KAF3993602.1 hypothetical protein FT662_00522 [[Candida] haemuloni var. vulneris]KAF3995676.1 hypothetical protein FT663_00272 [[Candida] haemuloni var. vulneris]PVH19691.1 hypothetical protein CXQ85_003545 [[Candida] haemuloni]